MSRREREEGREEIGITHSGRDDIELIVNRSVKITRHSKMRKSNELLRFGKKKGKEKCIWRNFSVWKSNLKAEKKRKKKVKREERSKNDICGRVDIACLRIFSLS